MVEIKTGWVSQLTPKTHIVIDEEIKTNNFYIRNIIMQSKLINDNYNITIKGNLIYLELKRMLERQKTLDYVQRGRNLDYYIFSNKNEYSKDYCIIKGRKVVKENKISIKLLNHLKELDEKKLDTNISVEINKDGYIFMFQKRMEDGPNPLNCGRTIEWWEDHCKRDNYFLDK
ncbi:MAG: hypothetical protein IKF82_00295 [Bacilli bacterium]|nr:hypothetical protein [Bacilli bacterium]